MVVLQNTTTLVIKSIVNIGYHLLELNLDGSNVLGNKMSKNKYTKRHSKIYKLFE